MRHRGFGLRSASVRAEQTSPGRLAPRPTTLSGVRTLRCLALKNASLRETFFNETSGIRTPDNLIKSQVLYHLSYTPSFNYQRKNAQSRNRTSDTRIFSPLLYRLSYLGRLRGQDLNLRPSGYEPDELPDCSTPRYEIKFPCKG